MTTRYTAKYQTLADYLYENVSFSCSKNDVLDLIVSWHELTRSEIVVELTNDRIDLLAAEISEWVEDFPSMTCGVAKARLISHFNYGK